MNRINQIAVKINKFLLNLYTAEETSYAEIINFLNLYKDYILLINNLNPADINVSIFAISEFGDVVSDFKIKGKTKKHKQRNRENSKKKKFTNASQQTAFLDSDFESNIFRININRNLCHAKSLNDLEDFTYLISDFGHEVEHIVQQFKEPLLFNKFNLLRDRLAERFEEIKKQETDINYVKKLAIKMKHHAENLNVLTYSEISADKKTVSYFAKLYTTINSLNLINSTDYNHFLQDFIADLDFIQKNRELYYYSKFRQRAKAIKKSLVNDFNINIELLEIP